MSFLDDWKRKVENYAPGGIDPTLPPTKFLGRILNNTIGDKKAIDNDAIEPSTSPIDFIAPETVSAISTLAKTAGKTALEAAPRILGNEIGSIGRDVGPKVLDNSLESRLARAKDMGFDTSKVMYHGSPYSNIEAFDPNKSNYGLFGKGIYLTDNPEIASQYSDKGISKLIKNGQTPQQTVYPTYVKAQNPIDMDAPADLKNWQNSLKNKGFDQTDRNEIISNAKDNTNASLYKALESHLQDQDIPDYEGAEQMQDVLRDMGHDSIKHTGGKYRNSSDVLHNVTIPFDPEQIRSINAIFDPTKADSSDLLSENNSDKFSQLKKLLTS